MRTTLTTGATRRLVALGTVLALFGPWACGRRPAQEEPAGQDSTAIQRTAGEFRLSLTGGLSGEYEGDAVCVFESVGDELRAVMHPRGEGACHYFILAVPRYAGEGDYRGKLGVTGVARSAGPAQVTVTRSDGDVVLELTADYVGAAGDGSAEGRAVCPPPE